MMPVQVHEYATWTSVGIARPGAVGAVQVNVNPSSGMTCTIAVSGAKSAVKYGGNGMSAMVPLQGIDDAPVTVRVSPTDKQSSFTGGASVDVYLNMTSGVESFDLTGVPVAGHVDAPVLILRRLGDGSVAALPPRQSAVLEGLGGWFVSRRSESGRHLSPTVDGFLIDSSVSLRPFRGRLADLEKLVSEVFVALGLPEPKWEDIPVGGARVDGVGSVHADTRPGTWVVVTDLPLLSGSLPALLTCRREVAQKLALNSSPWFVPSDDFWEQIHRQDTDYDDSTLSALDAFGDWLGGVSGTEEALS